MKTATVSARVEEDVKFKAEDILRQLGIPASVLINSLYRQIIAVNGIPFSLVIPQKQDPAAELTSDALDEMLEHSYQQVLAHQGRPMDEVFDELERIDTLERIPV